MCHFKAKDLGNKASAPESMGLAAHAATLSILAQEMLSSWAAHTPAWLTHIHFKIISCLCEGHSSPSILRSCFGSNSVNS